MNVNTTEYLISKITNIAKKSYKTFVNNGFKEFIEKFYEHVSFDELSPFDAESLCASTLETFKFLQKRKRGQHKIRVYSPTMAKHNWESEYTVIEVINDDMPFLVDSISEEISRHGLTIYQIAHPVIEIKRDKAGNFKHFIPMEKGEIGKDAESVMHFIVSPVAGNEAMSRLEGDILKVIETVTLSVVDWKPILRKASYVITELSASVEALCQNKEGEEERSLRSNASEIQEFIQWLKNNNFVFLGYVELGFDKNSKDGKPSVVGNTALGVLKAGNISDTIPWNQRIVPSKQALLGKGFDIIEITKSNKRSVVHRPIYMDYIGIKKLDEEGNIVGEHCFLGLFTSIVYCQSALSIPLLRKKIRAVQKKAGFSRTGHNAKALSAVFEDFPRDELFQTSEDKLFETVMGIVALTVRPRVRLFIRKDDFERFISSIVYLPRDRMSTTLRERIETVLCEAFNGTISNHFTQITESHLARLQFIVKTEPGKIPPYNLYEVENKLAEIARLWTDSLFDELNKRMGKMEGEKIYNIYKNAFNISYKNKFSSEDAYYDILQIEKVLNTDKVQFDLYESLEKIEDSFEFKVYSPHENITLSEIMPILESLGLDTIDEHTYQVTPNSAKDVWIHRFRFKVMGAKRPDLRGIKGNFEEAIHKIWDKDAENDALNKLILRAGLRWQEIVIIRAYCKYLKQAGFTYSQSYIYEALSTHYNLVKLLIKLFHIRFDPTFKGNRNKEAKLVSDQVEQILSNVSNLAEDRVIRAIQDLIYGTLRCNYFQKDSEGNQKSYISFKINSSKITFLPKPTPYVEIFVYSPKVEGIHLRGGKVARGGLRWSDRFEDFRIEILGLMKAQMTKNTVIIPVGSKGGFVVKNPTNGPREDVIKEGIECYKNFLRGLLDLTDNIVKEKISHPVNVVRYDDDDPYLVVAADKGTATFSDIANGISAEYNFWLGDAFASGGSVGYDHKKMAITARGAWISVARHFSEMGVDVDKDEFTVIGIGDMAGDVFGNGMLLSKKIKLIGAFNHMHIFIDPNPNASASFKERKRLFNLPRSSWKDYNPELISGGGGVFERSAKSIKLTREIKELLDVDRNEATPDELIKYMLKAKADLLWNGGIGTYVKAKSESNDDVGDKANDVLRINGEDLRVKVVGEGGNLGFTQLGRIEASRKGRRINTDAIDNSAGVDCSDHEVNIKIALGKAIEAKTLTKAKRDKILEDMTDEVAELVLRDNKLQTLAITTTQLQGHSLLETQARLISSLEKQGLLDRKLEFLPDDEAIAKMHVEERGLTRPEISVLLSYSKLSLYDKLLNSTLPEEPYYNSDLLLYFPEKLRKDFREELENHPLRREIIAASVTNSILNRIGSVMFYHLIEDTGRPLGDIAKAYTIVRDVFNLRELWDEIEALERIVPLEAKVDMATLIQQFVERMTLWFLKNHTHPIKMSATVDSYTKGATDLSKCLVSILPAVPLKVFEDKLKYFKEQKVPADLAAKIAGLESMLSSCDIIQVATKQNLSVSVAGKIYFELGAKLHLGWMRREVIRLSEENSYWQKLSSRTIIDDLYEQQKRLTNEVIKILSLNKENADTVKIWAEGNNDEIGRYNHFIEEIKSQDGISLPMLMVGAKKVKEICSN